jgi:hypothetical protein
MWCNPPTTGSALTRRCIPGGRSAARAEAQGARWQMERCGAGAPVVAAASTGPSATRSALGFNAAKMDHSRNRNTYPLRRVVAGQEPKVRKLSTVTGRPHYCAPQPPAHTVVAAEDRRVTAKGYLMANFQHLWENYEIAGTRNTRVRSSA